MRHWKAILAALVVCASAPSALAQWAPGAPGQRAAPKGLNRYSYFVFTDPLPGQEQVFNDWYLNQHLGDLVQLKGWTGAQRFRRVARGDSTPPGAAMAAHGYLVIWDQEGADAEDLHNLARAAIAGGKARRGAGFDYTPGTSSVLTYQAAGARIARPDGRGPTIPRDDNNATPRLGRYVMLDFLSPPAGVSLAQFNQALDRRIGEILRLPGWLAAQQLTVIGQAAAPSVLIIWETEGTSYEAPRKALADGVSRGAVSALNVDATKSSASFWEPISPYVTKDDFQR